MTIPGNLLSRTTTLFLPAVIQVACGDSDAIPAESRPLSELVEPVEALNLGPVIEIEFDDGKYEMMVRGSRWQENQVRSRSGKPGNTAVGLE
jgi:hypothetical protein